MSDADCFKIPVDIVWIVGRSLLAEEELTVPSDAWQLQGVAFSETDAIAMCRTENYFIGPIPVGCSLPHELTEWVGCYYPLVRNFPRFPPLA